MENLTREEIKLIERNRKQKEKKSVEFSKRIIFCVLLCAFIVIFFAMYMIRRTGDTSALTPLLSGTFAFSGVAVGFYANKAKAENVQKIKNSDRLQ